MLINIFGVNNTLICGWRFDPAKHITMHVVPKKQSLQKSLQNY